MKKFYLYLTLLIPFWAYAQNVGVGTVSPFYKLDVDGTLGVPRTHRLQFYEPGTGSARAFIGSSNIAPFNELIFGVGASVEAMRIIPNGNLGIGVTDPSARLHVNGSVRFQTILNGYLKADASGNISSAATIPSTDITGLDNSKWTQSGSLLYPKNTAWNVGVGTSAPSARLEVEGGNVLVDGGNIRINDVTSATGGQGFTAFGNGRIYITAMGTAPTVHNLLFGASTDNDRVVGFSYTPGTTGAAAGVLAIGQQIKNNANYTHGITTLYTNGLERMRVAANGTVGIGTSNQPELALQTRATAVPSADRFGIDNRVVISDGSMGTNRNTYGIYNQITNNNTTATNADGNYLYGYGAYNYWLQSATGKARQGWGAYNYGYNNGGELFHSGFGGYNLFRNRGTTPSVHGGYNYALQDAAATSTNLYGVYNLGSVSAGNVTSAIYGSRSDASVTSVNVTTLPNSYGAYNYSVNNVATATTTSGYGALNYSLAALGTITNSYGGFNQAQASGGTVTSGFGAYNYAVVSSTGSMPTARGSYNRVRAQNDGTMTNVYAVDAVIEQADAGAITNAYLFRGGYSGTITGAKYGVHISGETNNYLSGNLGVGTATIAQKLHVKGNILAENGAATTGTVRNAGFYNWTDAAYGMELHYNGTWGLALFARSTDSDIRLGHYAGSASAQNTLDVKMTIKNTGNVGIGLPNPTYKLHVSGQMKSDGFLESSDIRLKKNIETLQNALNKVMQLQGVSYNWKNEKELADENIAYTTSRGDKADIGLIAQEVEKILPQLVSTDSEGFKSVEYSKLVALLIEAVKEQQKTMENQQNELNELKKDNVEKTNLLKAELSEIKSFLFQQSRK